MAEQIDRYQTDQAPPARGLLSLLAGGQGREWTLRGSVRGPELREYREDRGLLDAEWGRLERAQNDLCREREEFERRSQIIATWELLGFALVVLLGLLMMAAGNGMLPR